MSFWTLESFFFNRFSWVGFPTHSLKRVAACGVPMPSLYVSILLLQRDRSFLVVGAIHRLHGRPDGARRQANKKAGKEILIFSIYYHSSPLALPRRGGGMACGDGQRRQEAPLQPATSRRERDRR